MEFIFGVISGLIFAFVWRLSRARFFSDGTFNIDTSNPEKDVYRIDIVDIDKLKKKKRLVFRVDPNADLSQK